MPSRALLAVELTAPSSSSWGNRNENDASAAVKVVLSCISWKVLDFVDVERTLAMKLKDNDLRAILVCIGAVNGLKRLRPVQTYQLQQD